MKKFLIILLIIFIAAEPIAFAANVGYAKKGCYVYAKPSTSAPRRWIAKNTKLYYVGTYKKFYVVRVAGYSKKVCILKTNVSKKKVKTTTPTFSPKPIPTSTWAKTEKLNWSKGKTVLKVGKTATLYDIKRGYRVKVKRIGGTNHMDLEPYSAADTKNLWHIAEGIFSWKCHPMILMVDDRYIACSINTMPHGKQSNKNNDFEGHFCLHLVGSKTHGTNKVNQEHQKKIEEAYKWSQK